MIDLVSIAREYAAECHAGHVDRAGVDYLSGHLNAVAAGVDSDREKAVAYLHDVIEDCNVIREDVIDRFFVRGVDLSVAVEIADAVVAISKKVGPDYNYMDYIEGVKENRLALVVKLSDLCHNSDLSRLASPSAADVARCEKYRRASAYLSLYL